MSTPDQPQQDPHAAPAPPYGQPVPPAPPARSSRGLRIALAVSVTLNLVIAGLVGGAILRDGPDAEAVKKPPVFTTYYVFAREDRGGTVWLELGADRTGAASLVPSGTASIRARSGRPSRSRQRSTSAREACETVSTSSAWLRAAAKRSRNFPDWPARVNSG